MLLSGGETTVTIGSSAAGRGGRNTEFLLGLAVALDGAPGIWAAAGDTDGIDGVEDAAGAHRHARHAGARPRAGARCARAARRPRQLSRCSRRSATSIVTGPTLTNVNDFRAILIA